ncbi:hypothetical protein V6N13_025272 [Hibiscus sabdariffa]
MVATLPPIPQLESDVPSWRWDEKREFWVSTAYQFLMDMMVRNRNIKWRKIWALKVLQLVRVFMWLAAHQAHLNNVERVRCHLATSDECALCHGGSEDMDHILRSCAFARDFWGSVLSTWSVSQFFLLPFEAWLVANIDNRLPVGDGGADWNVRFSIYCWFLWKSRCNILLDIHHVFGNHGATNSWTFIMWNGKLFWRRVIALLRSVLWLSDHRSSIL